MPELYTNQFLRDLTANYTAGSGTLSVSAAAPTAIQAGTFRVRLANTQNTLLIVTAGAATTTWTVTAEANDANCSAGPNAVLGCEVTAGMLDQIRSDEAGSGTFASRPAAYKAGTLYFPTDGPSLSRDTGSAFNNWGPLFPITAPPALANWTWVNQGTATAADAGGAVSMYVPTVGGTNWRMLVRPAPGSTPWTVVMGFASINHSSGNTRSGMVLYNNSSTKLIDWSQSNDSSRSISEWNSPTSWSGGGSPFTPAPETRWPVNFYRVNNDGTNLNFSIGPTPVGPHWIPIASQTLASWISSVTHIGFGIDGEGNSYDMIILLFHSSGF